MAAGGWITHAAFDRNGFLKISEPPKYQIKATMTDVEVSRSLEVFERELRSTRDPRQALRAAMMTYEARLVPKEEKRPHVDVRILLGKYRELIAKVCAAMGADLGTICGYVRAGTPEEKARGVLVGVFTDARMTTRRISSGLGLCLSTVNKCKLARRAHPDWEPLIDKFAIVDRKNKDRQRLRR